VKKKLLIGLSLIGILATAYWYYNRNNGSVVISYEELKKRKEAANQNIIAAPINNTPESIKTTPNKEPRKPVVYETKDDKFEAFDKMETEWLSKAQPLFNEKEYILYKDMRSRADQEKEKAYQAYHDYLRAKFGNNFKYNISEDQSVLEKKINTKYQKELQTLIGDDRMKKYVALREEFNEELRRKSNGKNFIVIEF
jgi:hypothetical protein